MTTRLVAIQGTCEERFPAIRDACAEHFQKCGEVGAAGVVTVDGKPVVDLSPSDGGIRMEEKLVKCTSETRPFFQWA
jgi:hypothetical protein